MPKSRVRKKNGKKVKHHTQNRKGLSNRQMEMIKNFLENMKNSNEPNVIEEVDFSEVKIQEEPTENK